MKNLSHAGPPLADAPAALILLHGRGAAAEHILNVYDRIGCTHIAALAPTAPGNAWYPYSFLAPLAENQPYLDQSLAFVDELVQHVVAHGIPPERIAFLGFSQGACLSLEYVIRNPRRYGAVLALTGGYIGPPGTVRTETTSLAGTPVFVSANDPDDHIPFARVEETAAHLKMMQADVECRRYPDRPHVVLANQVNVCRDWLNRLAPPPAS
jgi:phospholipase/carboxylesterase